MLGWERGGYFERVLKGAGVQRLYTMTSLAAYTLVKVGRKDEAAASPEANRVLGYGNEQVRQKDL